MPVTVTPVTYIRAGILIFTGVILKEGNTSDSNTSDIHKTWYTNLRKVTLKFSRVCAPNKWAGINMLMFHV